MSESVREFLKAVDIVCGVCVCRNEDNCERCPVRKTCDQLEKA